jgi:hypothetical protein
MVKVCYSTGVRVSDPHRMETPMPSLIGTALTHLDCTPDVAERIAHQITHDYLHGLVNPNPDGLTDLPGEARNVAGEITFYLARLTHFGGRPAADLGVAADHAALAVRLAITAAARHKADHTPDWKPLEAVVPADKLHDWMWMCRVRHGGRVIEQYKHADTRRYLNLDQQGGAWRISYSSNHATPDIAPVDRDSAIAWATTLT